MDTQKPEYEAPQVTSYTVEEILEAMSEAWGMPSAASAPQ